MIAVHRCIWEDCPREGVTLVQTQDIENGWRNHGPLCRHHATLLARAYGAMVAMSRRLYMSQHEGRVAAC